MVNERTTNPLLTTKLHVPMVDESHVSRPRLVEKLNQHRRRPLTLVSAPAGYGKSVLIGSWIEQCGIPAAWVSLDENDNELHVFVSYVVAAVEKLFPGACRDTQALLKGLNLPPVSALANSLLNELDRIDRAFILVLDDYYLIKEKSVHQLIDALLKHPPKPLHLVVIGRLDPPLPIATLRAKSLLNEVRTQDLRFTLEETQLFLDRLLKFRVDPSTTIALNEKTEGWVTGLRLAVLSMRHRGNLDPDLLEPRVDAQYVMEYLFNEVFAHQPPELTRYLLGTALLDRFCGPLCEAVCVPGAEPFTCETGGWEFITWLKKENLFLIKLDTENRWFRYHHLFQKLLISQLKRHCTADEIKTIHSQAGDWFIENGLVEEALRHILASGDTEKAAGLIVKSSPQMMDNQQWVRLERCLYQLAHEQIEQDPALLVLEAWLNQTRHNYSGMAACTKKIEALNASSPQDNLVNVKYLPGHFEALKGAKHYIAAEGEKALDCFHRAAERIPSQHKRGHLLVHLGQVLASQMIGDFEPGLMNYQKAMARFINRDNNYHSMYLAKLGLTYWIEADLVALRQTAEAIDNLSRNTHRPTISPYYRLYFMGIIHYQQNELKLAEKMLSAVVQAHYAASPINFAHSAFALSLTCQVQRKPDLAREICRTVVADSIESNNADMLKVARAFEAELDLRQGRISEASQWIEKYNAKPFQPAFRFYMPQITAAKTLLAQESTESLRQCADLLDQLLDFLMSIHNICFQIDVLALQALLNDTLGNGEAAMEKLTRALTLAEPGGFIRTFVDLGPRMNNLLEQLLKKNVAVDYIGVILEAIKQDETRKMHGDADHPNAHSHHLSTQPLANPLTNRELDVLALLSQRLQNKEIAANLFIAPETVKKHLNNIYRKLDVNGRQQAVEKARGIGIFST